MKKIKAIALDFDGVLTDGTFFWDGDDKEYKRLSFYDVMGISLGTRAGIIFTLISGENNALIDRFAEKTKIADIYKGCKDKAAALRLFAAKYELDLSDICFMGDDINDLPAMEIAGFSAAPATAQESIKTKAKLITKQAGGNGAVRELIDFILANNLQGQI